MPGLLLHVRALPGLVYCYESNPRQSSGRGDNGDNDRSLYSRFYEMYLRYEERLHFIQQREIQLQCPIESNDVEDYISGSTSANGNGRMRQRGRYRYMVSQRHIEGLFMLSFNWREIASIIGLSVDTLRRRRQEFGMNIGQ